MHAVIATSTVASSTWAIAMRQCGNCSTRPNSRRSGVMLATETYPPTTDHRADADHSQRPARQVGAEIRHGERLAQQDGAGQHHRTKPEG